jgi:uncharacterized protein with PIN domain
MEENQVMLRFYEELNDFLPEHRRKVPFAYVLKGNPSVKSVIEELGIPHVEVDMILVNSNPVNFSYRLKKGDTVSVYPQFESLDISGVQKLRPGPLRNPRFILDAHLGRLVRYTRLCGFDSLFEEGLSDREIIQLANTGKRIILTRDRDLLKSKQVTRGYWIRSEDPSDQIVEVIHRFDLKSSFKPFSRCIECNGLLEKVEKNKILDLLLPRTRDFYNDFMRCRGCGRIYWEGSHYERMKKFVESLLL